jgi:hypothetical protein
MGDPRIESALWRLTWKLRRDVPGPRRREIRRQLRADLRTTAAEVGAGEAIRRLGNLDELAASYAEGERGRPRGTDPVGGAVAAVIMLVLLVLLNGRYVTAFSGLKDRGDFDPWRFTPGGPGDTWALITLSGDVERDLLLQITVHRLAYVVLPVMAFVVWGRLWRGLRRPALPGPTRQTEPY